MMRVNAITAVPDSSNATTGVHRSPPGRSMISTPPKPTSVDNARRQRMRSPSIGTASTVIINGAVNPTAYVSARLIDSQEKYQVTETNDDSTLRASTMPQPPGPRPPNPIAPLPDVTTSTVTAPNRPRHSIASATPTVGNAHF